jgi:hypothetical protein
VVGRGRASLVAVDVKFFFCRALLCQWVFSFALVNSCCLCVCVCVCVAVVASRFDERLFPLWSDCMKLRDVSLLEDCRRHLIALRAAVSCVTSILNVCLFVAVPPPFPCVVCLDGKEEHGRVPFP